MLDTSHISWRRVRFIRFRGGKVVSNELVREQKNQLFNSTNKVIVGIELASRGTRTAE